METELIERFGVMGATLVALIYIARWFVRMYEEKEQRLMTILDSREAEIRRLVELQEEKERLYRQDIQELSNKFVQSLDRISGHIDRMTQSLEVLSKDVGELKKEVFRDKRRRDASTD
ncbi:hypothetical protein [Thermus phage TSP4]|nr:hypothetical protein [Thermus phage TSP4]